MFRPILRLLAVAAIVVVVLAVLAFVAGRASSLPAPAPATPTTAAGAGYIPDPAGLPATDPNGQWLSEPYPTSSAGGGR